MPATYHPFVLLQAHTAAQVESGRRRAESWLRSAALLVIAGVVLRGAQLWLDLQPQELIAEGGGLDLAWRLLPTLTVFSGFLSVLRAVWLSSYFRLEQRHDVLEQVHALSGSHPAVRCLLEGVSTRGMGLTEGEARLALKHGRQVAWPSQTGFVRNQLLGTQASQPRR